MKPFNKRINKRKASKVTLKTHHKHHLSPHDQAVKDTGDTSEVRPEDVKFHQQN